MQGTTTNVSTQKILCLTPLFYYQIDLFFNNPWHAWFITTACHCHLSNIWQYFRSWLSSCWWFRNSLAQVMSGKKLLFVNCKDNLDVSCHLWPNHSSSKTEKGPNLTIQFPLNSKIKIVIKLNHHQTNYCVR